MDLAKKVVTGYIVWAAGVSCAYAELQAMDDELMSGVSGQSGITLDLDAKINASEVAYFDDGNGIALQGVRLASAEDPDEFAEFRFDIDILGDGAFALDFESINVSRFEIEDIRFIDTPGVNPLISDPSMGGLYLDFFIDGYAELRAGGALGPDGLTLDASWLVTDGRLGYRSNGNELFLDGVTWDVSTLGTTLDIDEANGILEFRTPNFTSELLVDAIRYSNNPLNHGVSNDVTSGLPLASYGSLWASVDLDSAIQVQAQGRQGAEGLRLDAQTTINRLDIAWGDDTDFASTGYWFGVLGLNGNVELENVTVDVLNDPDEGADPAKDYGVGLALAFDRLEASLTASDIVLGDTKSNIDDYISGVAGSVNSIGGFTLNLLLQDGAYNGTNYTNSILVQAGGNTDAGNQGIRLDAQLNLFSDNNESNFTYRDDGFVAMVSNIEGFLDGDITLDVTSAGNINGTDFYDGIRFGFEDLQFGLKSEGLRIGQNGNINDIKSYELQSSYGFRGPFGRTVYPLMEGTLNGHITLGAGGAIGTEGLTVNSDISVSDATYASYLQEDGRGIWLSGLNYDTHLRDMTVDVTDSGLQIIKGEAWSKMDITHFAVGLQGSDQSFGRVVVETFEQNSEVRVSAGGVTGPVCIGGTGNTPNTCRDDGGHRVNRGDEGLTIETKRFFQAAIEAEGKRNRITWETSRVGEDTATPTEDSGLKLVFDNFSTNDGDGLTDTYGFNVDYNMDISRTRVLKKSDGPDSNGVVGNKGDEKIYNNDGTYSYVAPGDVTNAQRNRRPVGLAMRTRTHFKEFDIDSVRLSHPTGGDSTLLYGVKMQNVDITTDITATPLN